MNILEHQCSWGQVKDMGSEMLVWILHLTTLSFMRLWLSSTAVTALAQRQVDKILASKLVCHSVRKPHYHSQLWWAESWSSIFFIQSSKKICFSVYVAGNWSKDLVINLVVKCWYTVLISQPLWWASVSELSANEVNSTKCVVFVYYCWI